MPNSRDIPDFRPGERPGARRLSELAQSANKTQREFNRRELPGEDPTYPVNVGHLLISAVEGVGHYTAKFLPFLEKSITPASAVSATEIGTVGEDVLAMLVSDIGAGASSISVSAGSVYAVGHLTNLATNEGTPRRVVTIMGAGAACELSASIVTIGDSVEGSESADSTTWTRGTTPVQEWIQTRQAYYHAGDEKWYAYARLHKWDACGKLYSIDAETRIEIDAPEDC